MVCSFSGQPIFLGTWPTVSKIFKSLAFILSMCPAIVSGCFICLAHLQTFPHNAQENYAEFERGIKRHHGQRKEQRYSSSPDEWISILSIKSLPKRFKG